MGVIEQGGVVEMDRFILFVSKTFRLSLSNTAKSNEDCLEDSRLFLYNVKDTGYRRKCTDK